MNRYICEKCNKPCSQVYGSKVDNKYVELCLKCMFSKAK